MIQMLAILAGLLLAYESICFWIAMHHKRRDFADAAWGFGFVLIAWASFFLNPFSALGLAVNIFITMWAFRLSLHIYLRNQGRREDFRYQKWRSPSEIFLKIFLLQGAILFALALPIIWIHTHNGLLSERVFGFAAPVWLAGFIVEAISDWQLLDFQKKQVGRGGLLTTGLWSYVRHPNYLGELIQWWAIWSMAIPLPYGWAFCASPLLLTYLIVKVSGIAPLERKMKNDPAFQQYAQRTPCLIPPSLMNGGLYAAAWFLSIFFGTRGSIAIPLAVFASCYVAQLMLMYRADRISYLICIPLSIYSLFLGLIQETLLIAFQLLAYPNPGSLPPLWLLTLYPLFALTLNSSLAYARRSLILSFCIGGAGALLAYSTGAKMGGVDILKRESYPALFASWGLFLTILTILNRKMVDLANKYTERDLIEKPLTVFFDAGCPICSREMQILQKRNQTGPVRYACPTSDEDVQTITEKLSYATTMKQIHAIDSEEHILTGIDALSALYARTDLAMAAIWLQAPGFRTLFRWMYAIWAKTRMRHSNRP